MSSSTQQKVAEIIARNSVFLAPMAGVCDAPFRLICKQMGAGLTYTEMISAASIIYQGTHAGVRELLHSAEQELPHAIQLFGSDPVMIRDAAVKILEERPGEIELIDINMGCPVHKVVSKGEGSALMRTPDLAAKIISTLKDAVDLPVTAKFRSGWDGESLNAMEFALRLEDAGVDGICVHPRTREQLYRGVSDWSVITKVKEGVRVPVIGSGDLFSSEDVKAMMEQTGADAVMIARGAQGNPWIFTGHTPTHEERIILAKKHAYALHDFVGETRAVRRMRKHVMWYGHGLPGATFLRGRINTATTFDALIGLLDEYLEHLSNSAPDSTHPEK